MTPQQYLETLKNMERRFRQDARLYRDIDGDDVGEAFATKEADALLYAIQAIEERDELRHALSLAREFVVLANTVWADTSDGRHATTLADARMAELAKAIVGELDDHTEG